MLPPIATSPDALNLEQSKVNQQTYRARKCQRGSPEDHQQRALFQILMNLRIALSGDHKSGLVVALRDQAAILILGRIFDAGPADLVFLPRNHHELAQAITSFRRLS